MADEEKAKAYVKHWGQEASRGDVERVRVVEISDQRLANKILDLFVSLGAEGLKLAQRCVGVNETGGVDTTTLAHWNMASPDAVLLHLCEVARARYMLEKARPEDEAYWRDRASTLGELGQMMYI